MTSEEERRQFQLAEAIRERATGTHYDFIVLGGGCVGVKAAVEAAARGQRVALIEPKALITGAPTGAHSKCLRETALNREQIEEQRADRRESIWKSVTAVLERALEATAQTTARELRMFHVNLFRGSGVIQGPQSVQFVPNDPNDPDGPRELTCDVLMIATGSKSNRFPPVNFELPGVYDSDTIWGIDRIPERLLVQGAGIVGLEYAQIFAKLGSKVTVVEAFDKVVPMMDTALQQACLRCLKEADVEISLKTPIKAIHEAAGHTPTSPKYTVELPDRSIDVDCILSATGRHGWTAGIGLEALESHGLKIGRGRMVEVDENGFTGISGVYAAGDVAGCGLATTGMAMAVRAVRSVFGSGKLKDEHIRLHKPYGVWTIPEIAWAGMSEEEAIAKGVNVGVATVQYDKTVRGCVTDEDGFLKMVYDRTKGTVLGIHIFGENSCDLVNYGAECVNDENTIFDVLQMVFPAVTYHELYHLAASEAKIRMKGAKNLAAAAAWRRMQAAVRRSLEGSNSGKTVEEVLKIAFEHFDDDDSGYLSHDQLKNAMKSLGLALEDSEIKEMILEATDDPEDDSVDYTEFLKMLQE